MSKQNLVSNDKLEKDTIEFPKFNYNKCVNCGRCYISCKDGGHQAISFDDLHRKPILNGSKCVGCQLCKMVCPQGAISIAPNRVAKR